MATAHILLLALGAIGHFAAWTGIYNRFTARNFPKRLLQIGELLIAILLLALPIWVLIGYLQWPDDPALHRASGIWWQQTYVIACAIIGALWLLVIATRPLHSREISVDTQSKILSVMPSPGQPLVDGGLPRTLASIPGNQLLQLEVNEKRINIPELDDALVGLRIVHFSDLHFTGALTPAFYQEVIAQVNALRGDLIALTGDIVDTPKYLEWIEPLLGQLHAPAGVYFVLGNHDQRAGDITGIRQRLERAGLISVGGRWLTIRLRDRDVLIAGNERPWIEPLPVGFSRHHPLRMALLHTPDEIGWARAEQFQLVLAGHTHGGQIRLPWIGAVLSPSRFGTRYAGGTFDESPSIMHVTRGISGRHVLRFGCRPEITCLVLGKG